MDISLWKSTGRYGNTEKRELGMVWRAWCEITSLTNQLGEEGEVGKEGGLWTDISLFLSSSS